MRGKEIDAEYEKDERGGGGGGEESKMLRDT